MTFLVLSLRLLTVPEALAQHLETLGRLESYQITMNLYAVEEDGTQRLTCKYESWKRGIACRNRSRCLRQNREAMPRDDGPTAGDVYLFKDESLSATESRTMIGLDPDNPPQFPLEFGRNPKALKQIMCTRASRHPDLLATPGLERRLMREVLPGVSLAQLATEADLEVVEAPADQVLRLRVTEARSPRVRVCEGMLIDLDRERGCLICRLEVDGLGRRMVYQVTEFTEHDGPVWLPKRMETWRDGQLITVAEIDVQRVNEPIADADLVTQFPPGARVDDRDSGKILVWGQGQAIVSFDSEEDYEAYVYAGARAFQSQGNSADRFRPETSWLLFIVNAVLVGVLIVLTAMRRRLPRGAAVVGADPQEKRP